MIILKEMPIFGYESKNLCYDRDWKRFNKQKVQGTFKACLPIGNIIVLLEQLKDVRRYKLKGSIKSQVIARGILSFVCAPLVFLIDLIATAILHLKYAKKRFI